MNLPCSWCFHILSTVIPFHHQWIQWDVYSRVCWNFVRPSRPSDPPKFDFLLFRERNDSGSCGFSGTERSCATIPSQNWRSQSYQARPPNWDVLQDFDEESSLWQSPLGPKLCIYSLGQIRKGWLQGLPYLGRCFNRCSTSEISLAKLWTALRRQDVRAIIDPLYVILTARPIICIISKSEYSTFALFWYTCTPLITTVCAACVAILRHCCVRRRTTYEDWHRQPESRESQQHHEI